MEVKRQSILIVGCGPGSLDYVTPAALQAIESSDLLIGARRLLDLFPSASAERVRVDTDVRTVLSTIEGFPDEKRIAVLVTGDPGLHSLAKIIVEHFGKESCKIIPGISSVQLAFARLGLDWSDVRIVSTHKENPVIDYSLTNASKIAILGGRKESTKWVEQLANLAGDYRIFICENLTLPNEIVHEVKVNELASIEVPSLTTFVLIKRNLLK